MISLLEAVCFAVLHLSRRSRISSYATSSPTFPSFRHPLDVTLSRSVDRYAGCRLLAVVYVHDAIPESQTSRSAMVDGLIVPSRSISIEVR